jgi:hypothetical protein
MKSYHPYRIYTRAVLARKAVTRQLLYLTNISGELGRACARELIHFVNARAVVTTRRALAKVHLVLTPAAIEIKRTKTHKTIGEAQTSCAIEARKRLAIVDLLLAELTTEARLARAVNRTVG